MDKILLAANKIVVPREYGLGRPDKLRKYFDRLRADPEAEIDPVFVTSNAYFTPTERSMFLERERERVRSWISDEQARGHISYLEKVFERSRQLGTDVFYLIDGNHRTTAQVIMRSPIYGFNLNSDDDLARVKELVADGKIKGFPDRALAYGTIRDLVFDWEKHSLGNDLFFPNTVAVEKRVDRFVAEAEIPADMIAAYHEMRSKSNRQI